MVRPETQQLSGFSQKNLPRLSLSISVSQLSMLKSISFLFFLLFFISCQAEKQTACSSSLEAAVNPKSECWITAENFLATEEVPLGENSEIPNAALTFETNATLVNFTPEQEAKLLQATEIIKKVIATKEFRDGVLNHTWKGKKQFVDNQGLTNAEVYAKVLQAAESYRTEKNNALDVELEIFYEATNTIGYTFPHTKRIWMNKKYFDRYTPVQVSDNLFHEWLHKVGFDHSTTWSADRDHTVPYALGYLVERIAARL